MKPIILIGYMGAGKSTVGKLLARQQKLSFYDTDAMIEMEQNCTISEIFAKEGEQTFRDMETALIRRLIDEGMSDAVLSVGGGLPVREENRELLKELGTVVYLMADKETVVKRVQGSNNRPLLLGENLDEKVEHMLAERDPVYRVAADVLIDTNGKPVEYLAKEIAQAVKK
ncbi:MAG: shikimate kinase [Lachnospiraceae bacterium]|nr:shikimate kinase [Lachnospiraceae bacterium]